MKTLDDTTRINALSAYLPRAKLASSNGWLFDRTDPVLQSSITMLRDEALEIRPPELSDHLFRDSEHHQVYSLSDIVLGKGAFGEVRLIQNVDTGELFALKIQKVRDTEDLRTEEEVLQRVGLMIGKGESLDPSLNYSIQTLLKGQELKKYLRSGLIEDAPLQVAVSTPSIKELPVAHLKTIPKDESIREDTEIFSSVIIKDDDTEIFSSVMLKDGKDDVIAPWDESGFKFREETPAEKMKNAAEKMRLQSGTFLAVRTHLQQYGREFLQLNDTSLDFIFQTNLKIIEQVKLLHEQEILHNDLKPENIMIELDSNGRPLVTVIDFGVSMILETGTSSVSKDYLTGTYAYMPPEFTDNIGRQKTFTFSYQTDIYALGKTLEEVILMNVIKNLPAEILSNLEVPPILPKNSSNEQKIEFLLDAGLPNRFDNPDNNPLISKLNDMIQISKNLMDPNAEKRPSASEALRAYAAVQEKYNPEPESRLGKSHKPKARNRLLESFENTRNKEQAEQQARLDAIRQARLDEINQLKKPKH